MKTSADRNVPMPANHRSSPVLRLQDVTKQYVAEGQPVRALSEINFEVQPGSFLSIVGRSGCGKSTLLNLAGVMDFPTTGRVLLDGVQTTGLSDSALTRLRREKVGFIFQSFQLIPTLSAIENVELPLLLAGKLNVRPRAVERLDWVELNGLGNRLPYQLSGGQMQRVAIARALVHDPRLILADEPTGNLDTVTGDVILTLLKRITRDQGAAVLMATHSLEAAAISDSVVRLRDGMIEETNHR